MNKFLIKWLAPIILSLASTVIGVEVKRLRDKLEKNKTFNPEQRAAINQLLEELVVGFGLELSSRINNKNL